jgi:hypothetical protein
MPADSKLGAPSRQRLQQLRAAGSSERVSMFLRGARPFSPEQVDVLKSDGASIRTRAGLVLTVDVPIDAVERILAHDFIVASELSSPLYDERSDDGPASSG